MSSQGSIRSSDTPDDSSADESNRLLCHQLIRQLPPAGVREALEALRQMDEFHRLPIEAVKPLRIAPAVKTRVTGSSVAPTYPISEE